MVQQMLVNRKSRRCDHFPLQVQIGGCHDRLRGLYA